MNIEELKQVVVSKIIDSAIEIAQKTLQPHLKPQDTLKLLKICMQDTLELMEELSDRNFDPKYTEDHNITQI